MASIVLSSVGSSLGSSVGGPLGSFLGGQIGKFAGGFADGKAFGSTRKLKDRNGPRLSELGVQASTYGKMIPIVYGNIRLAGNIVWSRSIKETVTTTTSSTSSGGKGGGGGGTITFEWSHGAAATNFDVVWAVQALTFGDGDSLATSFSTADTVTATGGTADSLYRATTGFITIFNGPAANDTLYLSISRQASDGADTLAVDARLHNIVFNYFSDAATDD